MTRGEDEYCLTEVNTDAGNLKDANVREIIDWTLNSGKNKELKMEEEYGISLMRNRLRAMLHSVLASETNP